MLGAQADPLAQKPTQQPLDCRWYARALELVSDCRPVEDTRQLLGPEVGLAAFETAQGLAYQDLGNGIHRVAVEKLVQGEGVSGLQLASDHLVQAKDALADDPCVDMHGARGERGAEQLANRGMVDWICGGEDVTTGDIPVEASLQKRSAFAGPGGVDLTQGFDGVGGGLTRSETDDVA